ncbi:peptidoglycan-binding protein [Chryseolinea sp. T2]|uniref:peptidoglycan-binding protein n=1 Tax=Chryseolinea sp. T2 TaxID=3129255 RepID=UPI003077E878
MKLNFNSEPSEELELDPEFFTEAEFEGGEFETDEFEADTELDGEVDRSSIQYGMWIQTSLNKILGLRLDVDGIIGSQTRSAIRSFQQKQGLSADGIVGPITEDALIRSGAGQPPESSGPSPTPSTGTPDIVSVKGIRVARQIAPQIDALLTAAAREGVSLSGGGYRSGDEQIRLRIAHCGGNTQYNIYEKPSSQCTPPTAPPGRSMHEQGLAIDFTYNGGGIKDHSNPGYIWLAKNAARFGLYNLPSEAWHWSVNGR